MRMRPDGSLQSANTPTHANVGKYTEDYANYRCMVSKVLYADDPNNITKNAQNPEVVYEVIVLGGFAAGQIISNVRLSSDLGGNTSYHERTLKSASKPLNNTRLSDQDGDIVFVQFVQGHPDYPIIMSMGKGILDKTAATSATGPRDTSSYNGLIETIDNQGNLLINQTTGSTITIKAKNGASVVIDGSSDAITISDADGGTLKVSGGKVGLGKGSVELVDVVSQLLELLATDLGNLGYPLENSPQYQQLKTQLDTIKGGV